MPARDVNNTVPLGKILAELFSKPNLVILLTLPEAYIELPISTGEYQFISPSQYSFTFVEGVPPPTISATSPNFRCSQAAKKRNN